MKTIPLDLLVQCLNAMETARVAAIQGTPLLHIKLCELSTAVGALTYYVKEYTKEPIEVKV